MPRIGFKQVTLTGVVLALSAVVGYAVVRETAKPTATPAGAEGLVSAGPAFSAGLAMADPRALQALTPEEENYAAALWPIHSEVKLAATRMTFAGLNYKIEHHNARQVKASVQPLAKVFESAMQRVRRLQPPESLEDAHRSYLAALQYYAAACREMVKIADDGSEKHLLTAHANSERASHALLQLSDVLWPGEYKPN